MKTTRHDLLYPAAKQPFWGPLKSFARPITLEDNGYGISANPGSEEFNYMWQVNSLWNAYMDNNTRQLQPDVVVGSTVSGRVTHTESDFVAASLTGYNLLFVSGIVFTAARTLTNQVLIGMDSLDAKIDLDTFDFTIVDCSGYLGVSSNGGKVILDGHCRNLIIDGNVHVKKGSNFSGNYSARGITVGQNAEHKWGTSAQVAAGTATFYTDGSGNPLDKDTAAVAVNDDDKILISHDVTQTANLLLDCGGKKVTIEMLSGVTLDMDTFNLTLGGTGDSIGGDIRITQTGDLINVSNRGLTVNNKPNGISAKIEYTDLVSKWVSVTTVNIVIRKLKLLDENNNSITKENINLSLDITSSDRYGGAELASHWYQIHFSATPDGAVIGKLVPDLTGIADGTTAGKLIDSGASFLTYLVTAMAVVYNHTNNTQTKVSIDAAEEDELSLDDDFFVSGDVYTVHIVDPTLIGSFKSNIGAVYNNSGSDLTPFEQIDNKAVIDKVQIGANLTNLSYEARDISAIVPVNAKWVLLQIECYSSTLTTSEMYVASKVDGKGEVAFSGGSGAVGNHYHSEALVSLIEPQTFYSYSQADGSGKYHNLRMANLGY